MDGGNVRFDPLPARCKKISEKEKLPFFPLSPDVWTEKWIFQMILGIKNCRNTEKEREKEWMGMGERREFARETRVIREEGVRLG